MRMFCEWGLPVYECFESGCPGFVEKIGNGNDRTSSLGLKCGGFGKVVGGNVGFYVLSVIHSIHNTCIN